MPSKSNMRNLVVGILLTAITLLGARCQGLSVQAYIELTLAGVSKYVGDFDPISSVDVGDGWTKHTFDPNGGNGPICISGTPFSVFTRDGDPKKLLIFEQGGGACWQDFYQCNEFAEAQEPPSPRVGIWDFDSPDNPFADYSIAYMPYCDGSVFSGDNDVVDPNYPTGPIRYHRGLRNQTAGMDVARSLYPRAKQITVSGSSAGGVGASIFAPFLVRFLYGNHVDLTVLNDAGPVTTNLSDTGAIMIRAVDWDFGKFFPASCIECDELGQSTAILKWRLANDSGVRDAFYETDQDLTNRFFLNMLFDPFGFRQLIISEHGLIHDAYPDRYKRFIVAGDPTHTALQTPLFYTQDANGTLLNDWVEDFLADAEGWIDIVEDFVLP